MQEQEMTGGSVENWRSASGMTVTKTICKTAARDYEGPIPTVLAYKVVNFWDTMIAMALLKANQLTSGMRLGVFRGLYVRYYHLATNSSRELCSCPTICPNTSILGTTFRLV